MSEWALSELLRPELGELTSYAPHAGEFAVRLDANEAPDLLAPDVRAALAEALGRIAFHRYPDARATLLREALAARTGVTPDEILVGTGSDEIISLLLTAVARPRARGGPAQVLTSTPTFVMYRLSALVRGLRVIEVPLDDGWDLPVASFERAIELGSPNLVFIASPNNPTGNLMSRDRLERIIQAAAGALVIVDEAYVDYAPRTQQDLLGKYPNVALLRTLSKVGFAALRIGWLMGPASLVRELDKVRLPYNLPTASQIAAALVLGSHGSELDRIARSVCSERERVASALGGVPRLGVSQSDANFLWIGTERPAGDVFADLAARGVLVRSFHQRGGRLAHRLRITIGTATENDALIAALSEVA